MDASDPSTSSIHARDRAFEEIVTACMRKRGFDYSAEPPDSVEIVTSFSPFPRASTAETTLESIQIQGYGLLSSWVLRQNEPTPGINDPMLERMSVDERELWLAAQDECYKEASTYFFLADGEAIPIEEVEIIPLDDDPVAEAEAAEVWSACMASKGYSFTDRTQILDQLRSRLQLLQKKYVNASELIVSDDFAALQEEERALALVDYECFIEGEA